MTEPPTRTSEARVRKGRRSTGRRAPRAPEGPIELTITEPTDVDGNVPAAQIATVTNTFDMTELSVTKLVDTDAVDTDFGPFSFTLSCTTRIDQPVDFDGETEVAFDLEIGEAYTTPAESIPVGSTCVVAEVDNDAADDIVITGDGVLDSGVDDDGVAWASVLVGAASA